MVAMDRLVVELAISFRLWSSELPRLGAYSFNQAMHLDEYGRNPGLLACSKISR
jgi:hypothetical protein